MRILIFIPVFFALSCNNKSDKKILESKISEYPKIIDSLKLSTLFDSTKFTLYSYHCDVEFRPISRKIDSCFFSFLPMEFEKVLIKNDTVEIYFNYVYQNKIVRPFELESYVYLKNGIGYNLNSHKILYLTTDRNYIQDESGIKNSRLMNPLQPEVLSFVKKNFRKLNPWYREQLIQRKVILP